MLERLEAILGAFELEDGSYDLFLLDADRYRANMQPTRSKGASAG
jgi:hypothetical protein